MRTGTPEPTDIMEVSMRNTLLIAALLAAAVTFSQAQAPAARPTPPSPGTAGAGDHGDKLFTVEQMQEILAKGPVKNGKPAGLSTRLFGTNTYSCAFIRISDPDQPHTHGEWSEVLVITQGTGTIVTGGTMKGPWTAGSAVHQTLFVDANGNKTGSGQAQGPEVHQGDPPPGADAAGVSIENGNAWQVKPGDLVLIPAGTPHQWTKLDGSLVYLDIKFPKATEKPNAKPAAE
jgi:mannose-6-phosphate isomerase-like protein (cupin superfamily)